MMGKFGELAESMKFLFHQQILKFKQNRTLTSPEKSTQAYVFSVFFYRVFLMCFLIMCFLSCFLGLFDWPVFLFFYPLLFLRCIFVCCHCFPHWIVTASMMNWWAMQLQGTARLYEQIIQEFQPCCCLRVKIRIPISGILTTLPRPHEAPISIKSLPQVSQVSFDYLLCAWHHKSRSTPCVLLHVPLSNPPSQLPLQYQFCTMSGDIADFFKQRICTRRNYSHEIERTDMQIASFSVFFSKKKLSIWFNQLQPITFELDSFF